MKRWLKGFVVGVFVALVGIGLGLSPLGTSFEQSVGLGWLFSIRGTVTPPDDVVIVAMDSRTGNHLDLPALPRDWPRSIHARLVEQLVARGASTIVFDVHFGRQKVPDDDQVFVDAVAKANRVVLVELLTGKRHPISDQHGRHVGMVWSEETVPPFPALAEKASGLAPFPLPKQGAAVYQFWVFKDSANNAPTLPVVALHMHAKEAVGRIVEKVTALSPDDVRNLPAVDAAYTDPRRLNALIRGLRDIFESAKTDSLLVGGSVSSHAPGLESAIEGVFAGAAHRYLNFYGPPGTITTVPYHAVIKGGDPNVPEEALDFTGKTVFVGYSDLYDPGQPDRFFTVFTRDDGVDLAGVEIAATGFANLLTSKSLVPLGGWISLAVLAMFGLFLGALVYLAPAIVGVPIAIVATVAYALLAQYVFNEDSLLVPLATPLLVQAPLALFIGLLGQYLLERARGQRISDAINYYLPDDIARDLGKHKLDESQINKVVYSTCLATDMAGFSTISEQLPPGELAKYLNDYFETLAAPLKKHGVHVTEFRADAIMCAWTSQEESVEPRQKALLAALEANDAIKGFRDRHELSDVKLRIGLEVGWVYVGHAGGGGRFVYSIVGDTANTASRIEGLNKHIGTKVLATSAVLAGIDSLLTRHVGNFQFVGKTEALAIEEVVAPKNEASQAQIDFCEKFDQAMVPFDAGDWQAAVKAFEQFLQEFPEDGPAKFLLQRCESNIDNPNNASAPGVVRMDVK